MSPQCKPPRFPDPEASQQVHFDVLVDDIAQAEPAALALGATLVRAETDGAFRVYADPVGHTFCLVWLLSNFAPARHPSGGRARSARWPAGRRAG
nr:VOC family protein [Nocardia asiatica]